MIAVVTTMISNFIFLLIIAGMGLSLMTSPMGCFLVWRRMSFFGDALAHSALLGVGFGLLLNLNIYVGISIICMFVAIILTLTNEKKGLSSDTWLSIISYSALALGIILVNKLPNVRIDPANYLFGDILTLQPLDLLWIYGCAIGVWVFIYYKWQPLLLLTLDEGLAQAEGISITSLKLNFMLILALTVAISLKFVGALLVPALLVIPSAAARNNAKTPEQMIGYTLLFTFISITIGLILSIVFNLMTGPTIVLTSLFLFILNQIFVK
jgi:zinc transport system permease protein